jgi:hypothetical protein
MEFARDIVMPLTMISVGIMVMALFGFLSSLLISAAIKEIKEMWRD